MLGKDILWVLEEALTRTWLQSARSMTGQVAL